MSTERIQKVLANCEQGLSSSEQAQARANIGAQGALTAGPNIDIYNNIISTEKPRVTAGTNVSVTSSLDPQTRVITYNVSATDTTYTAGTNVSISDQNVISATDTTYGVFNTTTDGLVPASGENTGKFLRGDGTWQDASPSHVYGTDFGQTYGTPGTITWNHDDSSLPRFNKKLLDLNLPSAGWYLVNINGVAHFSVSSGVYTTSGLLKFRICTGDETAAINSQDGVFQIGINGADNYGFYATVLVHTSESNYSSATVNVSNNDYQPISGVTESFVCTELRITWQKVG
jgi:hypothetical protein